MESRLVKDKRTKKFRGFAFVTFLEFETVEKMLKEDHVIMGKKVELKKAFTKDETMDKLLDEKNRKVYITGISSRLQVSDLNQYFSKFGKIEDTRIIHDPQKPKQKGIGFVLFVEEKSYYEVL